MNVAILLMEDFPGSDNRVQRQCRSLQDAGHRVEVFCASGDCTQAEWEGVRISRSRVRRVKAGTLARRLYDYVAFPLSAAAWLRRHGSRFDLVQVANPPDWLVYAARGWRRDASERRLILDMHEPMPELMLVKTKSGVMSSALRFLQGTSCREADTVIAVTGPFRDQLSILHGIDAVLVRNGVDVQTYGVHPPTLERVSRRPVRIVYVGTVQHRFGVDLCVRAASQLRDDGIPVELDVIGDGVARQELESKVLESRQEGVRFLGQLTSAQVAEVLPSYSIGVVPYRDSDFMRLAESTKAFQYGLAGLPIVCSDLAPLRCQLQKDAALFFEPDNAAAMAGSIKMLIEDPSRALDIARRGQEVALEGGWDSIESTYLKAVTGTIVL